MSKRPQVAANWADDEDDVTIEANTVIDDSASTAQMTDSTTAYRRNTGGAGGKNKPSSSKTKKKVVSNNNDASSSDSSDDSSSSSGSSSDSDSDDDDEEYYDEYDTSRAGGEIRSDGAGGGRSDNDDDEEDDIIDESQPLPEHHCRYCRRSDPLSAVRCNVCKKWFCNTKDGTSGSHIVMHLAKCRHREISLHPDGPLGDSPLECYACQSKNVFLLGFLPSKEEYQVVILCREPCLNAKSIEELEWDPAAWSAIIEERQLLPWIASVNKNTAKKDLRVRTISHRQIEKLEEMWKIDPTADLDTVLPGKAAETLPQIPVDFTDPDHYERIFAEHIEAESLTDKESKEKNSFEGLEVIWGTSPSGKKRAKTNIPTSDNILREGDDVMLIHPESSLEVEMTVIFIAPAASMTDEVHLEVAFGFKGEPPSSGGYTLRCKWNKAPYERMTRAIRTFKNDERSISSQLFERILGFRDAPNNPIKIEEGRFPKDLNAPNLPPLNPSQSAAVRKCLRQPLSLIQGPPGTGKTQVSATIVYHLIHMHPKSQVLVCAPSNVAVDHLCEKVAKTGLNVVRVVAKSREGIESSTDKYALHHLVREFCNSAHRFSELNKLFKLRDTTGMLNESDKRRFAKLCGEVERLILEEADVVCATCVSVADSRLASYRFKFCLIDECTHAQEPECIIPLVTGVKQAILVGDHCQMRPVVLSKAADESGLGRSLFERLVVLGNEPHRLAIQYRMHPCLSAFSSNAFYDGELQNGVSAEDRNSARLFPWPDQDKPMLFYNSLTPEEIGPSGVSYLNRQEAAIAEKIVTRLLKSGSVTPDQIGVITPYEAQKCFLVNYMGRNGTMPQESYRKIEVQSVDSFQGREKEFIILTCVRSNTQQGIGFLADWRRLNVALTRAKRGLFVIGNGRILASHFMWHRLLSHFQENRLIVAGPIDTLQRIEITLPKPRIDRSTAEFLVKHGRKGASYLPAFMTDASVSEMAASTFNQRERGHDGRPILLEGQTHMPPMTNLNITQQQIKYQNYNSNYPGQQHQHQQLPPTYFQPPQLQSYVPGQAFQHYQQMNNNMMASSYAGTTTDGTESTAYY